MSESKILLPCNIKLKRKRKRSQSEKDFDGKKKEFTTIKSSLSKSILDWRRD